MIYIIIQEGLYQNKGRFPFNQNCRRFGNSDKWYRNFPEKFPEIPDTVQFAKCEPVNRKV